MYFPLHRFNLRLWSARIQKMLVEKPGESLARFLDDADMVPMYGTGQFDVDREEIFGGDILEHLPTGNLYSYAYHPQSSGYRLDLVKVPGKERVDIEDSFISREEVYGTVFHSHEIVTKPSPGYIRCEDFKIRGNMFEHWSLFAAEKPEYTYYNRISYMERTDKPV